MIANASASMPYQVVTRWQKSHHRKKQADASGHRHATAYWGIWRGRRRKGTRLIQGRRYDVDKNVLIQYVEMKEEIKDLRRRIHENERELAKLENMIVTDSVTRGKRGKKPLGTVKITGRPTAAIALKQKLLKKRNDRLTALEAELLELTNQAEEYIETIPKSELRIMFRFYFLDGMSYLKVAKQMNRMFPKREIKYTDENVKKRIQRYFENVQQCPDEKC